MEDDQIDLKGFEQLQKALKGKLKNIKVGIIAGGGRQSKGGKTTATNATVGAVHEFGAPARNIPQRSFLRIPLAENLQKEMESSGLLDEKSMADVIKEGSTDPWLKKIAIMAESVVMDAFETGGNGKWPQWKDPSYTNEGGMLLVDTQQLRDSITTRID